jgi:hypothetical protein
MKLHISHLVIAGTDIDMARVKEVIIPSSPNLKTSINFTSKHGFAVLLNTRSLYMIDAETATLLHSVNLNVDACLSISPGATLLFQNDDMGYNLAKLKEDNIVPYLRKEFPHNRGLVLTISGRLGLPGAEDLWMREYPN